MNMTKAEYIYNVTGIDPTTRGGSTLPSGLLVQARILPGLGARYEVYGYIGNPTRIRTFAGHTALTLTLEQADGTNRAICPTTEKLPGGAQASYPHIPQFETISAGHAPTSWEADEQDMKRRVIQWSVAGVDELIEPGMHAALQTGADPDDAYRMGYLLRDRGIDLMHPMVGWAVSR